MLLWPVPHHLLRHAVRLCVSTDAVQVSAGTHTTQMQAVTLTYPAVSVPHTYAVQVSMGAHSRLQDVYTEHATLCMLLCLHRRYASTCGEHWVLVIISTTHSMLSYQLTSVNMVWE